MVYPNEMHNSIIDIDIDKLIKIGIKGIILDVDNTLIDTNRTLTDDVKHWVENAKKIFKVCILSNTVKKHKVEDVANKLKLQYFMFAKKPMKKGFEKCIELLNLNSNEICVIGDQIFTDILGGNRMGMYTIYTKPISKKDCSITTIIKRPLEKKVLEKYIKEGRNK